MAKWDRTHILGVYSPLAHLFVYTYAGIPAAARYTFGIGLHMLAFDLERPGKETFRDYCHHDH